jgi:hypothetical protein
MPQSCIDEPQPDGRSQTEKIITGLKKHRPQKRNCHRKNFSVGVPFQWPEVFAFYAKISTQPGRACPANALSRPGPEPNRKKLFVSGFYESPGSKTNGLNPGDSANPDTAIKFLFFCTDLILK